MLDATRPMGIFDSGVGGLTVLRRIAARLPNESIIYLGDTARVPYGTKSADTVIRYARACARILIGHGIKLLVVACNTASAYALEALREELDIPVVGVIEPGAQRAVQATRNSRIGVIGTSGTIASGRYQTIIRELAPQTEVYGTACPLFVPLAEEGWVEGDVPMLVAQDYLEPLLARDIDTLVLGCTHYPLLTGVIARAAGPTVTLVDSAEAVSVVVEGLLEQTRLQRPRGAAASVHRFMVTDAPDSFDRIGQRFLGYHVGKVEWVDLG